MAALHVPLAARAGVPGDENSSDQLPTSSSSSSSAIPRTPQFKRNYDDRQAPHTASSSTSSQQPFNNSPSSPPIFPSFSSAFSPTSPFSATTPSQNNNNNNHHSSSSNQSHMYHQRNSTTTTTASSTTANHNFGTITLDDNPMGGNATGSSLDFSERQQHLHQRHSLLLQVADLSGEKRILQGQLEQARQTALRVQRIGEERVEMLTRRLAESQNEVIVATQHYNEHIESLEELLALERKRRQDESDHVQALMLQLRSDIESSDAERLRAREQIDILEEQISAMMGNKSDEVSVLSTELANAKVEAGIERANHETEKAEVQGHLLLTQGELRGARDKIAELQSAVSLSSSENARLRGEVVRTTELMQSREKKHDENIKALSSSLEARERQLEMAKSREQALTQEVRNLESKLDREQQQFQTQVGEFNRRLQEITAETQRIHAEKNLEVEEMRTELKERLAEIETQIILTADQATQTLSFISELRAITTDFEQLLGSKASPFAASDDAQAAAHDVITRLRSCIAKAQSSGTN